MEAKKYFSFVPNTITSFNVISGSLSVAFAFEGNLVLAGILIIIAAVFDFLDGMSARLLGAYSDMGKELDSLADMISFGLAPAVIAHMLIRNQIWANNPLLDASPFILLQLFAPFIIVVFSALRLAKFNVDERQTETFIGLATPANALIWASLPFILAINSNSIVGSFINTPWIIILFSIIMSYMLVAELPMFSLKFKNLKFAQNKTRFIFLILSLTLLILLQIVAIPLIILLYILISIIEKLVCKEN